MAPAEFYRSIGGVFNEELPPVDKVLVSGNQPKTADDYLKEGSGVTWNTAETEAVSRRVYPKPSGPERNIVLKRDIILKAGTVLGRPPQQIHLDVSANRECVVDVPGIKDSSFTVLLGFDPLECDNNLVFGWEDEQ